MKEVATVLPPAAAKLFSEWRERTKQANAQIAALQEGVQEDALQTVVAAMEACGVGRENVRDYYIDGKYAESGHVFLVKKIAEPEDNSPVAGFGLDMGGGFTTLQ